MMSACGDENSKRSNGPRSKAKALARMKVEVCLAMARCKFPARIILMAEKSKSSPLEGPNDNKLETPLLTQTAKQCDQVFE